MQHTAITVCADILGRFNHRCWDCRTDSETAVLRHDIYESFVDSHIALGL